jgi:HD superfamily phosphodiesterase
MARPVVRTLLSGPIRQEILMTLTVQGVRIPDSKLAREITELVRDTESPLLFHHSSRVYYFGALAGKHRGLVFDPELLYAGAMFHDMGSYPKAQQQPRALRGGRRERGA